jgi:proteasome lid subunit RPN8/RPN11
VKGSEKVVTVNKVPSELNIPENGNIIELNKADAEKIFENAVAGLPNEACGLLGGAVENDVIVIKEVYVLKNIDESREHFTMDPAEQLKAIKDMRSKGLKLIGNWHSHPESPARPSEEDKKLAHDSNAVYSIISLMEEGKPVLNAYSVKNHTEVSSYNIILK